MREMTTLNKIVFSKYLIYFDNHSDLQLLVDPSLAYDLTLYSVLNQPAMMSRYYSFEILYKIYD